MGGWNGHLPDPIVGRRVPLGRESKLPPALLASTSPHLQERVSCQGGSRCGRASLPIHGEKENHQLGTPLSPAPRGLVTVSRKSPKLLFPGSSLYVWSTVLKIAATFRNTQLHKIKSNLPNKVKWKILFKLETCYSVKNLQNTGKFKLGGRKAIIVLSEKTQQTLLYKSLILKKILAIYLGVNTIDARFISSFKCEALFGCCSSLNVLRKSRICQYIIFYYMITRWLKSTA